jgi:hypothetical protein
MLRSRLIQLRFRSNISRRFSSSTNNPFWKWTANPDRPYWLKDYKEFAIAFCVFGVTGSTSAMLIKPAIENVLGIRGSIMEGPNSYRVTCLLIFSPMYALTLMLMGTIAGRHVFFSKMGKKILCRFIPFKSVRNKVTCPYTEVKP